MGVRATYPLTRFQKQILWQKYYYTGENKTHSTKSKSEAQLSNIFIFHSVVATFLASSFSTVSGDEALTLDTIFVFTIDFLQEFRLHKVTAIRPSVPFFYR